MGKATNPRAAVAKRRVSRPAITPGMSEVERLSAEARHRAAAATFAEPKVNKFAEARGSFEEGSVVDLSGELGGKRMSIVKVLVNRGGTAVDRWMARDEAGLFDEPQQEAIRLCRLLWARASGLTAIDPTAERIDRSDKPEGWTQQEALDRLSGYKKRIPPKYWDVFENVVRFDEEAGTAGSAIASNSRSAIDAAKTTVAFCASLVAMWERL